MDICSDAIGLAGAASLTRSADALLKRRGSRMATATNRRDPASINLVSWLRLQLFSWVLQRWLTYVHGLGSIKHAAQPKLEKAQTEDQFGNLARRVRQQRFLR